MRLVAVLSILLLTFLLHCCNCRHSNISKSKVEKLNSNPSADTLNQRNLFQILCQHGQQLLLRVWTAALQFVWALLRFFSLLMFPLHGLGRGQPKYVDQTETPLPLAEKLVSLSPKEAFKFAAQTLSLLNSTELSTPSTTDSTQRSLTKTDYPSSSTKNHSDHYEHLRAHFCGCPPSIPNLTHNFESSSTSKAECIFLPETEIKYGCRLGYKTEHIGPTTVVSRLVCTRTKHEKSDQSWTWQQPLEELFTDLEDSALDDDRLSASEWSVTRSQSLQFLKCVQG